MKRMKVLAVFCLCMVITAGLASLLVSIFERKQEGQHTYVRVADVDEDTVDAAEWGKNWPRQYDGYSRTSEPTRTKYGGGSVAEGGIPDQKARKDPWLTRLFAGYLFAVDYRDRRGHAFMLEDQEATKRNVPHEGKQSGNCLHCHASVMPLYRSKGAMALPGASPEAQVQKGLELVAELSYWDAHKELGAMSSVKGQVGKPHPVSCVDCHNPKTMELRVTRPGFINAIQALAASDAPTPHLPSIERWRKSKRDKPYDPNVDGFRQEMRSFVCGQCHVEYFCGKGQTIFFPWQKGMQVEQIEATYNALESAPGKRFKDWVHAETGMEVLKAQHPEFEVWSQGIHARSGVACADCHMPYKREGAMKVSEHWVRSPLLMINRACQTCHPYAEEEIRQRVETIQDRHYQLMSRAGSASVAMIDAMATLRKSFGQKNEAAIVRKAEESLAADAAAAELVGIEREKRIESEKKAALQMLWRGEVSRSPALKELEELQRSAQWRLDFVAAENSMGFHAPQETARILGESIDLSRQAERKAAELHVGHK
jgi:nitrite reductase (cytochrome c-552)